MNTYLGIIFRQITLSGLSHLNLTCATYAYNKQNIIHKLFVFTNPHLLHLHGARVTGVCVARAVAIAQGKGLHRLHLVRIKKPAQKMPS